MCGQAMFPALALPQYFLFSSWLPSQKSLLCPFFFKPDYYDAKGCSIFLRMEELTFSPIAGSLLTLYYHNPSASPPGQTDPETRVQSRIPLCNIPFGYSLFSLRRTWYFSKVTHYRGNERAGIEAECWLWRWSGDAKRSSCSPHLTRRTPSQK